MRHSFLFSLMLLIPSSAMAEPLKIAEPISSDEDTGLAQRYGADYSPQTDAGKKAQAAAIAAANAAACPNTDWTTKAKCGNDLREKQAIADNFPWMDLVYAYDAKILQASEDADTKRIKDDEFSARIKVAEDELQQAIAQRAQAAQTQRQSASGSHTQQRAVLLPPAATVCESIDGIVTCAK